MEEENTERAEQTIKEKDWCLARHSTICQEGIDRERARIIGGEKGRSQRKMLEGVETVKEKVRGRKSLNTCNQNGPKATNYISIYGKNLMIICVPSPCKSAGGGKCTSRENIHRHF